MTTYEKYEAARKASYKIISDKAVNEQILEVMTDVDSCVYETSLHMDNSQKNEKLEQLLSVINAKIKEDDVVPKDILNSFAGSDKCFLLDVNCEDRNVAVRFIRLKHPLTVQAFSFSRSGEVIKGYWIDKTCVHPDINIVGGFLAVTFEGKVAVSVSTASGGALAE